MNIFTKLRAQSKRTTNLLDRLGYQQLTGSYSLLQLREIEKDARRGIIRVVKKKKPQHLTRINRPTSNPPAAVAEH